MQKFKLHLSRLNMFSLQRVWYFLFILLHVHLIFKQSMNSSVEVKFRMKHSTEVKRHVKWHISRKLFNTPSCLTSLNTRWTNIFWCLERYNLKVSQMFLTNWTNTLAWNTQRKKYSTLHLAKVSLKYILQFKQIYLAVWKYTVSMFDKYIWQIGQIH